MSCQLKLKSMSHYNVKKEVSFVPRDPSIANIFIYVLFDHWLNIDQMALVLYNV